ncbi:Protein TRM32 [Camellia lanceoleosa]|uniref:Protein TRM32 n=1 Tax=Camellia lanceoleosa TaxID=1840588 RepID=A0ACC0IWC7_9ERIC|nr:Protein TRM32 [Camellia lanceoleosa]
MAKKSQRHPIRYDKDQAGCIWGFISFFDFRYGRSTRKRLLDRRRQNVGARYSPSKLHMRKNSNGDPQEIYDGKERDTPIADDARTSVKDLMAEEMFSEQEKNKQTSNAGIEAKESDPGHSGRVKKNHKRTSKSSKSSCDINYELDAAENLGPDNSRRHDSEEKTFKNLDMEVLLNEICQQIYQNNDLDIQSVFDEKFVEAIKVFVDQRFTNGKIDRSKEFTDILQTLSSNKELILKLLKDPNSLSMKQFDNLEDGQSEKDQNLNSSARFNLLDGELNNSKPSEPVARKPHNFFRRKSKSQEKIVLNGDENCQNSSRIVILKPGSQIVQISETEMKLSSPPQAHHDLGTKVQTEKIASQFSFTEIKRKLKNAMGKERHGSHSNDQNTGNNDKGIGREKGGWNSPNRNHFYNERFARPTIGVKNKDNNCKLKDTETSLGNETVDFAKLRVSNIYVEAKKHLSEMLSNGDEIEDFSSQQLPKSLGRILSLPEFNLSPTCSPRRDNANTGQLTQENHVSHLSPSQQDLNDQSCISDNPEDTVQSCNTNSDVLDELARANAAEETSCSMRPEKSCEGDVEILETYELVLEEIEIMEIGIMDISAEQCGSSVIGDERNGDLAELCNEDESAPCLKLDSFEQDQLLSSSLTSPPSSSITKHVEDLDSSNERSERPSPVSVLEPLFTEDDISPARIKSQTVEPPIQPLQIHFEERMICATSREICISTCMEDEESAFEYVEAVLLASDLNWEEFLLRWLSSDQILDASLFDEVELFSNRSCHDQKLLFDCTNEVLQEACERYFGNSPWVSFIKHNIRPIPRRESLIHEVWEGVEWHLLPMPSPHTLDQIVRKDMAKTGTWMDLRFDVESIGIDIGEAIFEELVEDAILSFVNEGEEVDSSMLPEELVEINDLDL